MINDALTICRALGYDMNSIEFAIRDGVPYAIDFMNPAPDMDINSLTPTYFDWVVQHMADLAIALAKKPRRQVKDLKWEKMFTEGTEGSHEFRVPELSRCPNWRLAPHSELGTRNFLSRRNHEPRHRLLSQPV